MTSATSAFRLSACGVPLRREQTRPFAKSFLGPGVRRDERVWGAGR
jgi:hypothetical protein